MELSFEAWFVQTNASSVVQTRIGCSPTEVMWTVDVPDYGYFRPGEGTAIVSALAESRAGWAYASVTETVRLIQYRTASVSGHGRFNTEGNGQVYFTLSNERVTFDRTRGERFSFAGEVTSVTGSENAATLIGTGSWTGKSGYTFEASVIDNARRGATR